MPSDDDDTKTMMLRGHTMLMMMMMMTIMIITIETTETLRLLNQSNKIVFVSPFISFSYFHNEFRDMDFAPVLLIGSKHAVNITGGEPNTAAGGTKGEKADFKGNGGEAGTCGGELVAATADANTCETSSPDNITSIVCRTSPR
uniref:Uncharacterized protein n=1 Tax=Glossina brevipalpis TaxID=37001 RepID=A0A1A9WB62_9MUSC